MKEYLEMLDKIKIPAAVTDQSLNVIAGNIQFEKTFINADKIFPGSFYASSIPDFSSVIEGRSDLRSYNTLLNVKGKKQIYNIRLYARGDSSFLFCAVPAGVDGSSNSSIFKNVKGLRAFKSSLDVLINKVQGMVFIHNHSSIFFANNPALKFLGYKSMEELQRSGRCLCSFFEEADELTLKNNPEWKELISSGLLKGYEKRVCITSAQTGDVHSFIADVVSTGGAPDEFITVLTDITDLFSDQKHNETSEEKFREMFFGHSAPMLIIDNDNNGKVVEANNAACQFYGYAKDELVSMHIDQLNIMPPEAIKKEMLHAKSRARNYFNFIHRLKDGNVKNVEVYSSPIDYNGRTVLCSVILDSTEKKLYEIQLKDMNKRLSERIYHEVRQSEQCENKFRLLADMVQDAVVVIGADRGFMGRIIEVNDGACELLRMEKSSLLSVSLNNFFSESDWMLFTDFFFSDQTDQIREADMTLSFSDKNIPCSVSIRKMNKDDKVVAVAVLRKKS